MSDDSPPDQALDCLDDSPSLRLTRREFIGFMGATLAASACGGLEQKSAPPAPIIVSNPFTLGVASGDPTPRSVMLWTRLATAPIDGGGMADRKIPVIWEVSREADFYSIEASGWAWAEPELGHSVHVELEELRPDTWYWYRFRVGSQWVSPAARTRTFPRRGSSPKRMRMACASCQNYQHGYYHAHRFLAEEDVDFVAFLGDYIYEAGFGGGVRRHDGPRPRTVEGFRNRYALYKLDPDLQAAHHAFPWVLTWDDHEVKNNYADIEIGGAGSVEEAKKLRAAAYQAYYEHMPLRIPAPDEPVDMQIYRSLQYGDLVDLSVLDGRQYRTDQPCNDEAGQACDEIYDEANTMLGDAQKAWLKQRLRSSSARWNAILQQTVFASINLSGAVVNPDQWDGYVAERQELLSVFAEEGVSSTIVHTGDVHAAIFASLHAESDDFGSEIVGYDCVATSISSNGLSESDLPGDLIRHVINEQENVHHFEPDKRGYCVCEYTRDTFRAEYRVVSTVKERVAELSTDAVFEVDRSTLQIANSE